ncbi:unnamed protein product [Pleuronectes platessa]|uniref:Uncharacterized protein n=1 Tax=Pleuronectes platessa TaxID=8262 RepID=A0A9N7TYR1_PLEPL|nr:unnamed protein product [Pleuronectes platessa]
MPTHQPMRACHASVSAPSRSLELGSRVILARCPDRSVKEEEEMFLYLECSNFISRIYSRSNTRITSRHRELSHPFRCQVGKTNAHMRANVSKNTHEPSGYWKDLSQWSSWLL